MSLEEAGSENKKFFFKITKVSLLSQQLAGERSRQLKSILSNLIIYTAYIDYAYIYIYLGCTRIMNIAIRCLLPLEQMLFIRTHLFRTPEKKIE